MTDAVADATPNLFIVGWPKTGSTSLFDYLGQHPEICAARRKDTYYFSDDLRASSVALHGSDRFNFVDTPSRYTELFADCAVEPVVCEASVFYALSSTAATNIADHNPHAKIVALLREPVSLLRSWYNYQRLHSRETAESFKQALELEGRRNSDPSLIPDSTYMPLHVAYRKLAQFDVGLRRFYDRFPAEQVLVILSDDLRQSTLETTQRVYDFVGVDSRYIPTIETRNVTVKPRMPRLKRFTDTRLRPAKTALGKVVPLPVHERLRQGYTLAMNRRDVAESEVAPDIQHDLRTEFLPMLRRTEQLTGVELVSRWGY